MQKVFESFVSWLSTLQWVPDIVRRLWQALLVLSLGESTAVLMLFVAVAISSLVIANRFFMLRFEAPLARAELPPEPPRKGFGLKHLLLLVIAVLPGGLVGSVLLYTVIGKEHWRASSLGILVLALIPAFALILLRMPWFPHPELRDALYAGGVAGLSFGVLQFWICIKILREYIGEPDVCVPWWPPLAWWFQAGMLALSIHALLRYL
jgi:hypothetical protein